MAPHTHIPAPRNTIETYSARPEREPPRNEAGEIICEHDACRGKGEIFRRPCEWNKHMDKHERPYKCNEPTCEQNPGFTYSGGLLRHMREVHKKGVGPTRRPLYCPHANCIRSTGEGFTRRENLEEHLRRRHSYTGHYSPPPQSTSSQNEAGHERAVKRRKTNEPESPLDGQAVQNSQGQGQQAQDSRRESLPHSVIDERLYMNGTVDAELDRTEAIRQLAIARQTINDQQEIIRRQDHELHHLRSTVQGNSTGTAYPRPPGVDASGSLPVQAPQQDIYPVDPTAPAPQTNGSADVAAAIAAQEAQALQKADEAQENGNEPSRRIEITRDLVGDKLAAAKATQ